MTVTALKDHLDATPFTPFDLVTASGKSYRVKHPDYFAFSPTGRTCVVFGEDDHLATINLLTITELVSKPAAKRRSRR